MKLGSRPPGETLGIARRQPTKFWSSLNSIAHRLAGPFTLPVPALGFCSKVHFMAYRLTVYTISPGTTPVTGNLLVFGTLN